MFGAVGGSRICGARQRARIMFDICMREGRAAFSSVETTEYEFALFRFVIFFFCIYPCKAISNMFLVTPMSRAFYGRLQISFTFGFLVL